PDKLVLRVRVRQELQGDLRLEGFGDDRGRGAPLCPRPSLGDGLRRDEQALISCVVSRPTSARGVRAIATIEASCHAVSVVSTLGRQAVGCAETSGRTRGARPDGAGDGNRTRTVSLG